jgi:mRNA interferase MazF
VAKAYVPDSGEVVWLQFAPQAGHEQSGLRPALVLTPAAYNGKTGLMLCCPMTSQIKGYPFEVRINNNPKVAGAVLADQVKSLDWRARKARRFARVSDAEVAEVRGKLKALIGIA